MKEAIQRWEQDGAAPTWRVPGLGTACLAGVDSTEVVVVDDKAYAEWASLVHPEVVSIVLRIPVAALEGARVDLAGLLATALPGVRTKTNLEVDPLLIKSLGKTAVAHDGALFTEDGAVEGVRVVPKTPYLSVRLAAEAKARAKASLEPPTEKISEIRDLIERSSLGTPGAKALRARTPRHVVERIVSHVTSTDPPAESDESEEVQQ